MAEVPKVEVVSLDEFREPDRNVRSHDEANRVAIASSFRRFGAARSGVVDKDGIVRAGAGSLQGARAAGIKEAVVVDARGDQLVLVRRADWSEEEARAYAITDNRASDLSRFDYAVLQSELAALPDISFQELGWEPHVLHPIMAGDLAPQPAAQQWTEAHPREAGKAGALSRDFLVPPFNVFDARQGYWQDRKRFWEELGVEGGSGRPRNLLSMSDMMQLKKTGGTSVFDPVLNEILLRWFCPPGGLILDPFAGGSTRGLVAGALGFSYRGVDIRQEQIEANERAAASFKGPLPNPPRWLLGDSAEVLRAGEMSCDFVLSCPPYHDLEVYSDLDRDISNLSWEEFCAAHAEIVKLAVGHLREDRFAAWVVGDFRGPAGSLRRFPEEAARPFYEAGLELWNDAVLLTALGSLPNRVRRAFGAARKLGRTFQQVMIFVKGDPEKAVAACGGAAPVERYMPEGAPDEQLDSD